MLDLMSPEAWLAFVKVVMIDLVLAGDNAIVIGLAAAGLPKTRSGKIMRRILRKIAEDDFSNLGDTTTLADPAVVDDLIANRQNKKA